MKKQEPLVSGSELTRDIRITGDADLKLYSEILSTVTIKCPMDVSDFPYDEHECFFEVTCLTSVQTLASKRPLFFRVICLSTKTRSTSNRTKYMANRHGAGSYPSLLTWSLT